jgi:flagellar biosynthesis anti-sigma factor FlgM
MKIEGDRTFGVTDAQQSTQAERLQQGRAQTRGAAEGTGGDRVEVSADARLLSSAVTAAERAPEIRQDVVERARQKLAAGEIGNDPARLADRIIDSLLS